MDGTVLSYPGEVINHGSWLPCCRETSLTVRLRAALISRTQDTDVTIELNCSTDCECGGIMISVSQGCQLSRISGVASRIFGFL